MIHIVGASCLSRALGQLIRKPKTSLTSEITAIPYLSLDSNVNFHLKSLKTDSLTWAELAKLLDTKSRALECGPIATRSIQNTTNQLPWKGNEYSRILWLLVLIAIPSINYMYILNSRTTVTERFQISKSKQVCFNCLQ